MKKRTVTLFITFLMLFNLCSFGEAMAAANRAELKKEELELAQNVMDKLEIMEYSSDNEQDIISRIDFAIYLGRLLKVDEYAQSTVSYYTDVPDDHYALTCVNYLTENGGFDGYGNGSFRPNDPIAPIEAAKVIFNILGYRSYAMLTGGYPSAYQKLADKADLLEGFSGLSDITRQEMTVLLLRAGFINMAELGDIEGRFLNFDSKDSETAFEKYWDIYDNYGVVKASGIISLDSGIKNADGKLVLNDKAYSDNGINTENFLGRYVRAVTQETDGDDLLIYAVVDDKYTNEICVGAKEFENFSDNTLYYSEKNSEKTKRAKIADGATVLFNGEIVQYAIDDYFDIDKGEIYLIDVTDDNFADTVIINSYRSYVVGYIDLQNELIYDKVNGGVIVSLKDYDRVGIHNVNGDRIDFSSILIDSVITVKSSDRYIDICVTSETVSGKLSELFEEKDIYYLAVDEENYVIDSYLKANNTWFMDGAFAGKIGENYTFFLDSFGYIVYITGAGSSLTKLGYVVKYVHDEDEDAVIVKLLTTDGDIGTYNCADRVKIDGTTRKTTAEILTALQLGDGEVVQYRLDADEKLSFIDTDFRGTGENGKTLTKVADKKKRNAKLENASLDGDIRPSSQTIKFIVPDENKATAPQKDYSVGSGFGFAEDENVYCAAYTIDDDNIAADVLVVYRGGNYMPDFRLKRAFVINEITLTLNEDDEPVYQVEGYIRGSKKTYTFANDVMTKFENIASNAQINSVADLEPGDILRIAENDNNEIYAMQLMVDYSEGLDTMPKWGNIMPTGYGFVDVQTRLYCRRAKDGIAELMWEKADDAEVAAISNMNGKTITVVDTSKKKDMVRPGTVDDVQQYRILGANTKPMFIFMWRYSPRDIVIYK